MYYTDIPKSEILEKQRLNFRLPDFTRIIWASGDTRDYWPEKIRKASNDWQQIEKLAFQEGVKDSILIFLKKDSIKETKEWCERIGASMVILGPASISNTYSSYGSGNGNKNGFRVAITKPKLVGDWYDAWNGVTDNMKIGELLGYPKCCQEFFEKYWVEENWRDLTYPAYVNSDEDANGPIESNILGRWAGIRWVSHMPCSFHCEHSVEIGKEHREIAKRFGYSESADTIDEVLGWSTRWSALHGIMEIKTPVYKVSAATEATSEELVIERKGTQPKHAASGLGFPFENRMPRSYTEGQRFEASLDAVYQTDLWEDNGFSSKEAMRKLQQPVIDIIEGEYDNIIDLGSGNGVLLEQIKINTGANATAVEIDSDVVERGREKFPSIRFFNSDIFDFEYDSEYDITIFMPGRLTETTPDKRNKLIEQILDNSKFIVFYMYADWVEKYGDVKELVKNHIGEERLILLEEITNDETSVAKYQVM